MAKNNQIGHVGIVKNVTVTGVEVIINSQSACGGCHLKGACGLSESKDKIIITEIPDFEVKTGDRVEVKASMKNAMFSVVMAYVVPAILLIAIVFILSGYGLSEVIAAIGALIGVIFYYVCLYFFRDKLNRKITFTIEKKEY